MSIENDLKRIADSLEILAAKVSGAGFDDTKPTVEQEANAKEQKPAARTRRTKQEMAADAEAAAAKAEVIKAEKPAPEVVEAAPFEYDYLKTEVLRLANMGGAGRVATAALMKEFGVAKAIEVPVGRWNELFGRIQAEIAKLEEDDSDFT